MRFDGGKACASCGTGTSVNGGGSGELDELVTLTGLVRTVGKLLEMIQVMPGKRLMPEEHV